MRDRLLFNVCMPAGIGAESTTTREEHRPPFLTQPELACRWRLSARTLEKWRWTEQGPADVKLGGRVVYRIDIVEAYEAERRRMGAVA